MSNLKEISLDCRGKRKKGEENTAGSCSSSVPQTWNTFFSLATVEKCKINSRTKLDHVNILSKCTHIHSKQQYQHNLKGHSARRRLQLFATQGQNFGVFISLFFFLLFLSDVHALALLLHQKYLDHHYMVRHRHKHFTSFPIHILYLIIFLLFLLTVLLKNTLNLPVIKSAKQTLKAP